MGCLSDPIHSAWDLCRSPCNPNWIWVRSPTHTVWHLYQIRCVPCGVCIGPLYIPHGLCIGPRALCMGSVSGPIDSVWNLHQSQCIPYGICIGSRTPRIGSVSDPIHSVWDLYQIPYTPYWACIGPTHARPQGSLGAAPRGACCIAGGALRAAPSPPSTPRISAARPCYP